MVRWTVGREYFAGYVLMLAVSDGECFCNEANHNQYFRLVLLEEGILNLTINGSNVTLAAPHIICLNNKDVVIVNNSSYKINCIYFHPGVVNSCFNLDNMYIVNENSWINESTHHDRYFISCFLERNDDFKGLISPGPVIMEKVQILFNKMKIMLVGQGSESWPCISRSYLISILIMLKTCCHNEENSRGKDKLDVEIEAMLQYINANYEKKITLDTLSREFNINRTTLNQRFLEATNSTAIAYLIKHRLIVANAFLRNTALPITEISDRIGFNDSTSFTRAFKKQYGMSPSSFRKYFTSDKLSSI